MNLKEAFRFQNRIKVILETALGIIGDESNTTKVQNTVLVSKAIKGSEDIISERRATSEYSDKITELSSFVMYLLEEKEKLFTAIQKTKSALDIDIDCQTVMNAQRQEVARYFRRMDAIRSSEKILTGEGKTYTFNTDGNQVPVVCDLKQVTTINFDRNRIKSYLEKLDKVSDSVSEKLDIAVVTSKVDYDAPFDVNASFANIFEEFIAD